MQVLYIDKKFEASSTTYKKNYILINIVSLARESQTGRSFYKRPKQKKLSRVYDCSTKKNNSNEVIFLQ